MIFNHYINVFSLSNFHIQDGEETSGKHHPTQADDPSSSSSSAVRGDCFCINAKVIVYAALSGMVSFLPDGTIYGCNHHFAVMLFGYSQEELLKKVRGRQTTL